MAYIGNKADTAFTSLIKQDLTGASGTSLTLTHSVSNANDIALYINNVRQEPISAYSTSGTAVTLTGSVASSDDIYVIYLARAIQTTVPPDGSVSTAKIASSAVNLTSKVTGILPIANGGTGDTDGRKAVAWSAKGNSNQSISHGSQTRAEFPVEEADTHNAFASSIFTVPSGEAGLYLIGFNINWYQSWSAQTIHYIRKNGGVVGTFMRYKDGSESGGSGTLILNLAVGNTIDIAVYHTSGATRQFYNGGSDVTFWGYKIGVAS